MPPQPSGMVAISKELGVRFNVTEEGSCWEVFGARLRVKTRGRTALSLWDGVSQAPLRQTGLVEATEDVAVYLFDKPLRVACAHFSCACCA
jgi:hypothetical protein